MTAKKFNAATWVKHEVESLIDNYGGTEAEQLEFVHHQLVADEYRDALTDAQAERAAVSAFTLIQKARENAAQS